MKPVFSRPCLLLFLSVLVVPPSARADIDSEVQAVMRDRLMTRAKMGVEVIRLGNSPAEMKEIYARDGASPLIPASNLKIITTSAALDKFGADFKFRTALIKHDNDVVLIGDGDPTFGDAEFLKKVGWKVTTVYEGWAAQLKKLGVDTVKDVIVDDSVFDETFYHPNWPANQADYKYMAEVGGMNFNANLLDVYVQPGAAGGRVTYSLEPVTTYVNVQNSCVTGSQNAVNIGRESGSNRIVLRGQTPARGTAHVSVTIYDPPMYAATVLADTLAAGGVKVTGKVRRDRNARQQKLKEANSPAAAKWLVVGIHETPLAAVISCANKDSVNLYAESLCKRLGYEATHTSGTWESGTAAVGAFLKKVGTTEAEFHLDDGCGLSREDTISPRAITRVLSHNFYGPNHQLYFDSLSVAGVDGTLVDRFKGSDLRRRIFGKSGYIEGVSTLSGLLQSKNGQWYTFSIMINGAPRGSNSEIKLLQERIVRAIDAEAHAAAAGR